MRYLCSVCGYVYDGDREGVPFADLPEGWQCPVCRAAKSAFVPEAPAEEPAAAPPTAAEAVDHDLLPMSAGELAALCSNLARGCEKQYKGEEAALFRQLADYFTAADPAEPEGDPEGLEALLRRDLETLYPAARQAAAARGDRGTLRVCTWGEKVTNMQLSLLRQYRQAGEALLRGAAVWVCSVCGFLYIGDAPLDLCPVCKVPAWKFEKIEGRESA